MLPVQFQKQMNKMLNEQIVVPRLINTQTVEFNDWCARLANGSTVTAADVAAVMQQMEDKLIEILVLNAKVVCSPSGLIFRPKVSGSISQSQVKARLEARKLANPTADIDVNREITTSDLTTKACTVSIEVALPKGLNAIFEQKAELKRVVKGIIMSEDTDSTDDTTTEGGSNSGGSTPSGGGSNNNPSGGGNTGGNNGGSGGDDENGDAI